jgi:hypothetical protein
MAHLHLFRGTYSRKKEKRQKKEESALLRGRNVTAAEMLELDGSRKRLGGNNG